MANPKNVATDRQKLSARMTSSHEQSSCKRVDNAGGETADAAIGEVRTADAENTGDAAPTSDGHENILPAKTARAPTEPPARQAGHVVSVWGIKDESTFQALLSRRKASGYQRRGKDVGGQIVAAGSFKPNADTVVAVIIGIVAERGDISRSELVDAMATATFPHAKARPADKGWCQGYVAGAIRNGFLTLVEHPLASTSETA